MAEACKPGRGEAQLADTYAVQSAQEPNTNAKAAAPKAAAAGAEWQVPSATLGSGPEAGTSRATGKPLGGRGVLCIELLGHRSPTPTTHPLTAANQGPKAEATPGAAAGAKATEKGQQNSAAARGAGERGAKGRGSSGGAAGGDTPSGGAVAGMEGGAHPEV